MPELPDDIYFDANGALTERRPISGQDAPVTALGREAPGRTTNRVLTCATPGRLWWLATNTLPQPEVPRWSMF